MSTAGASADGRAGIDAALVRRLLAEQHPQWADLSVAPVPHDGHDNRTYRLGDELTVRLPTDDAYVPSVGKEHRWLPLLAPHLPVEVPEPVALGEPSAAFPRPWSVRRWIPGETLDRAAVDHGPLARDLADALVALQSVGAAEGPGAGPETFHRGGTLMAYDAEVREAAILLGVVADPVRESALASRWARPPVWFHGDVAVGNLLVRDGRLCAFIDFGTFGTGDPACDLVVAWTLLDDGPRATFRERVGLDEDTWARARGWALWKALVTLAHGHVDTDEQRRQRRALDLLLRGA